MEDNKGDIRSFSSIGARRRGIAIAGLLLIVVLVAALWISIGMRSNIQVKYAAARNKTGEALYHNLYILTQSFDMTTVPNADVRNVILPQMREYYIASTTLNSLVSQAYGPRYALLTESDINDLNNAFTSYETAFNANASTDLAQSNMLMCMNRIKELLNSRYSQGVLKPGR